MPALIKNLQLQTACKHVSNATSSASAVGGVHMHADCLNVLAGAAGRVLCCVVLVPPTHVAGGSVACCGLAGGWHA